ncbi:hypothetical protein TWF696_003485 [Orbilia brochopaga]|uniref:Uncharacterized protein n=1 Tax=Orbilia brochopaga TaxID=3140254 RepID=A0AAV9U087_9PEZI
MWLFYIYLATAASAVSVLSVAPIEKVDLLPQAKDSDYRSLQGPGRLSIHEKRTPSRLAELGWPGAASIPDYTRKEWITCLIFLDPMRILDKEYVRGVWSKIVEGQFFGGSPIPKNSLYFPAYAKCGTPFVMVKGSYSAIESLILDDLEGSPDLYRRMHLVDEKIAWSTRAADGQGGPANPPDSDIDEDWDFMVTGSETGLWRPRGSLSVRRRHERVPGPTDNLEGIPKNFTEGLPHIYRRRVARSDEMSFDVRWMSNPPPAGTDSSAGNFSMHGVPWDGYYEDSQGEGVDVWVLDSGFAKSTSGDSSQPQIHEVSYFSESTGLTMTRACGF